MASKMLTWWRKYNKRLAIVCIIAGIIFIIAFLIIIGLTNGTGFGGYSTVTITTTSHGITKEITYQGGKTLWDWLQLLIVPLALAIIALLFNLASTHTEQKIAAQRYEQDQKIALDKQREDLLQHYLDCMAELLLEKQLHSPTPPDEARNLARVRTITVLFQLDARRIGYVFAFLREAGLMSTTSESIVSFKQADLNKINFSQAVITDADLREARLSRADLSNAVLRRANLSGANMLEAKLNRAYLNEAKLNGVNLRRANLSDADLSKVSLNNAYLIDSDLSGAYLGNASLSNADLSGATLIKANLSDSSMIGIILSNANLSNANLIKANLTRANFREAILIKANFSDSSMIETILSNANLSDANLSNTNLSDANLSGVNLSGADLSNTNLWRANLSDANLSNTNLSNANLSEAILSGVTFSNAKLQGVKGLTAEELEQYKTKGAII